MRNTIIISLMLIFLVFLVGCTSTTGNVVKNTASNLQEVTLEIQDMTCQSCALGVEYELKQVDGVVDAKVDYTKGTGIITFDENKVDAETIAKASTIYPAKVVLNSK